MVHALREPHERRLPARLAERREVLAVVRHKVMMTKLLRVDQQTLGREDDVVGCATHLERRRDAHKPVLAGVGELEHIHESQQRLALQDTLVRLVEVLATEVNDADREADEDAVVPVLLAIQVARHRQVVAGTQQSGNQNQNGLFRHRIGHTAMSTWRLLRGLFRPFPDMPTCIFVLGQGWVSRRIVSVAISQMHRRPYLPTIDTMHLRDRNTYDPSRYPSLARLAGKMRDGWNQCNCSMSEYA